MGTIVIINLLFVFIESVYILIIELKGYWSKVQWVTNGLFLKILFWRKNTRPHYGMSKKVKMFFCNSITFEGQFGTVQGLRKPKISITRKFYFESPPSFWFSKKKAFTVEHIIFLRKGKNATTVTRRRHWQSRVIVDSDLLSMITCSKILKICLLWYHISYNVLKCEWVIYFELKSWISN